METGREAWRHGIAWGGSRVGRTEDPTLMCDRYKLGGTPWEQVIPAPGQTT